MNSEELDPDSVTHDEDESMQKVFKFYHWVLMWFINFQRIQL